jgi:hypothetical protein
MTRRRWRTRRRSCAPGAPPRLPRLLPARLEVRAREVGRWRAGARGHHRPHGRGRQLVPLTAPLRLVTDQPREALGGR